MSAIVLFVFSSLILFNLISMFSPSSLKFQNLSYRILTYPHQLCQDFFPVFKGFKTSYRLIFKQIFIYRKVCLFFLFHLIKLLSNPLLSFSTSSFPQLLREYSFLPHCPVPKNPASEQVPY